MKYHCIKKGTDKSLCGNVVEHPATQVFDKEGFLAHYYKEGRCKTCSKILNKNNTGKENDMEKFEMFDQCGALVGLKFKAAPDSDTPNMQFEIIENGLKDDQGFPAVKLRYADGETEIAAIEILRDGVKNRNLITS